MKKRILLERIGVALAAFLIATTAHGAAAPPPKASLSAKFPSQVTMNVGPAKETIDLTLANNGKGNVTLTEDNECRTHTYTVSDAQGKMIEDHSICTDQHVPVSLTLRETETKQANEPVVFDSKLYQDGAEYTVTYRFWGIEVQKKFKAKIVK